MNRSLVKTSGLLLIVLLALLTACGDDRSYGSPEHNDRSGAVSPASSQLSVSDNSEGCETVNGAIDPCEPRDVSAFDLFSGRSGQVPASGYIQVSTVEESLELGLGEAGVSPTHLVFRGTGQPDSVRCDWRGIARTADQREDAIRLWLRLGDDDPIPSTEVLEVLFAATLDVLDPPYRETAKSNFMAIAHGGLSTDYPFLTCYADYTVSQYVLGNGPDNLTAAYDRLGEARSYELYQLEHSAGRPGHRHGDLQFYSGRREVGGGRVIERDG